MTEPPSTTNNVTPIQLNAPNATLYVSNIDWKIKKPVLKRSLYTLFSRHGKILEIITLRAEKLRGQAWIMFDNVTSATIALQAEQNFNFFGKELKVAYAKEKSDRIAKLDGTFVPKDRRVKQQQQQQQPLQHGKRGGGDDHGNGEDDTAGGSGKKMKMTVVMDGQNSNSTGVTVHQPDAMAAAAAATSQTTTTSSANTNSALSSSPQNPTNILFAERLPLDCNEMMLAMLFRQYTGYKEVRMPRPGLAFVEFDDEPHATVALKSLNGFSLTATDTLNLKYGKV